MKVTAESAILGIGYIILAYEIIVLKLRDDEIVADFKIENKILHMEIDLLRETSSSATASRNLDESPFTCSENWCVATSKHFSFPKGVVVGQRNRNCNYGDSVLSVDRDGTNCPSGNGSVTFGASNTASDDYASVTGGFNNTASAPSASVTGGSDNTASGDVSSVSGGSENDAMGKYSSVSGGLFNVAYGVDSSVIGGINNNARGIYSSVFGGDTNHAVGNGSSVVGGYYNIARGLLSSVSGGSGNDASGEYSAVSGGSDNDARGEYSTAIGGRKSNTTMAFEVVPLPLTSPSTSPFTCDGSWCTSKEHFFLFPKGIVVGQRNRNCNYGDSVLSVDRNGDNCPSGNGSVTFGVSNTASDDYASVTGGLYNTANGQYASVTGGLFNEASGVYSSVNGGKYNNANGGGSSVPGGYFNISRENIASAEMNSFQCVKNFDDVEFTMNKNDVLLLRPGNDRIIQFKSIAKLNRCDYKHKSEQYKVPGKVDVNKNLYFACFDFDKKECYRALTVNLQKTTSDPPNSISPVTPPPVPSPVEEPSTPLPSHKPSAIPTCSDDDCRDKPTRPIY